MAARKKSRRRKAPDQAFRDAEARLKRARETLERARIKRRQGLRVTQKELSGLQNREYREMRRIVKSFGLYDPAKNELTKSTKRSIRGAWNQLEQLRRGAAFAEYPTKSKKTRSTIAKAIRNLGGKVTKRGVFLPRSEKEIRNPVGRLRFDKRTSLWTMDVRTPKKDGSYAQEARYLADSEALSRVETILEDRFNMQIGRLPKNQRMKAIIGKNETRRSFRTMKGLLNYLAHYRKDDRARATFLSELTFVVVEQHGLKGRQHRTRRRFKFESVKFLIMRRKGSLWVVLVTDPEKAIAGPFRTRAQAQDWIDDVSADAPNPDLLEGYYGDEEDEEDI